MKWYKKGAVILSSLMLSVAIVAAGCSDNTKDGSGSSQPSGTGGNEGSGLKPYEVIMVYPDAPQKDNEKVQDAINDYLNKTYPEMNVTVKLNPIDWGAWSDKTNLMMASGDKFDLIFTADWLNFQQQVTKGALLPLDELLAKYGPDIEAVEKDYHDAAKRGGKLYGIHTHQELGNPQGLAFSKELVDKYQFDLSVFKSGKVEDLEPMLKIIKENEPGVTPLVGPGFPLDAYYGSSSTDGVANVAVLDIRDTSPENMYKVVNTYEVPRYMELAKLTHKWFEAGYINKDATTAGLDIWKKFQAKRAFATVADMDIVANLDIGVPMPMPSKTAVTGTHIIQVPLNIDRLQTGKMAATMQAISKTSKDPERAMMLLNLFFKDKELLTLFNFGIEGTHYVVKDGQIALPDGKTSDTVGYYHDNMWQIGNQMLNYTRVGEDPKKYENYEAFNKKVAEKESRIFGFVFDPEPVKDVLIAIDNAKKSFDDGLRSGQLDPEENIPKLLDKLKAAGIDKLMAEAQKQVDEWRAANGK
ncbi:ABC transporter substrate-binding protein [Paenibacillus caui]|uniref:ABC transporter substrate-binding protein n=1 Tax=Paenibacillus caui TaxID=2873927 RepID=UPI001CA9E48A|nr:ABC transporter substrate-binding protein [Paenibacillus caui]